MTKRIKVESLEKIWDGNELLIEDFSNLDLEGLDLSKIPYSKWEYCIFDNTSVKNTGIEFFPDRLKIVHYLDSHPYIYNCDFSGNNFSEYFDYFRIGVYYYSCDFSNTNISTYLYGEDNKLDKSCTSYYLDPYKPPLDIKTIRKSPWLELGAEELLYLIKMQLKKEYFIVLEKKDIESAIELIEECLSYDKEGKVKKFYEFLKEHLTKNEIVISLRDGIICNKTFKILDLANFDNEILEYIDFSNCKFENIIFTKDIDVLTKTKFPYFSSNEHTENIVNNILLPEVNYDSWRLNHHQRVAKTPITFRTNLYLELGRTCNANCSFCKNNFYCNDGYNFNKIKGKLEKVIPYIDSVVIGGGEPTLKINDLKCLLDIINYSITTFLFTNGSCKYIDMELYDYNVRYNISRHAIDDEDNANIFGLEKDKILSTKELENFIVSTRKRNSVTLAATCFKGTLDSKEKIMDYIKYALSIGCKSVLLSDLMVMEDKLKSKKNKYNVNIDDSVFEDVVNCLELNGFEKKLPIYSTAGYVLTLLKKDGVNISIKHYISKKELENNWPNSFKRTFDLSIDPKGNLYENWHQTSGLVKKIK